MNDYQMLALSNDFLAQRRTEADRARLARSGRAEPVSKPRGGDPRRQWDPRVVLTTLFRRLATL